MRYQSDWRGSCASVKVMAWSLSQEDDGLEPVSGEALAETHLAAQRGAASKSPERSPASSSRPIPAATFSEVTPTSRDSERALRTLPPRHRAQEPTLVLRDRQLDSLRAEVKKHRRAAERRQSLTTVLWGVAGGIAVLVGALLARALTRSNSENLGAIHPGSTEVGIAETGRVDPPAPMPSARPKSAARDRRRALSLDELPTE